MPKRLLLLALAVASTLSACGGGSSNHEISVAAISKCAHARPQTISASTPTEQMISQKTSPGGWLFQDAGGESEAEEQAHAPGFDVYVFPNPKTAKEAFSLISSSENATQEFGAGGTFAAKNVVISTDQESPQLDTFANALLRKCAGSAATQSIHREASAEGSSESASEAPAANGADDAPSEAPTTGADEEVGTSSQDEASAGQSAYPGERR